MSLIQAILLMFAGPEAGFQDWEVGGGACIEDKNIHGCPDDKNIHGCPDDKNIHGCPAESDW